LHGDALRRTAILLAAVLVALAAAATIVALILHADGKRAAQLKGGDVATDIAALQNMPWRLVTYNAESDQAVLSQVRMLERRITVQLADLQRSAPTPSLGPLDRLLNVNFRLVGREASLLSANRTAQATQLEALRFRSQDQITDALNRTDLAYHDAAVTSEIYAAVGAALIVLLLLSGFAVFYRRAFRARRAAESLASELADSQRHLEQAQRLAAVGSWEVDLVHGTFVCSVENARLHGWDASEPPMTTHQLLDTVGVEDRDRVLAALTRLAEPGGRGSVDYRVRRAGEERLIHLDARVAADAEGHLGLIGTCQDVTDRLRRLEAERANHAKSEFISRMSHELRTPLNAILGFGQLLSMSELTDRDFQNVGHIVDAGQRLLELIDGILDLSRIESGRLRLNVEPVNVREITVYAVELMRRTTAAGAMTFVTELGADDMWARADGERLQAAVMNLISNAIKFNREGGRVVVAGSIEDGSVRVTVSDEGPGIPVDLRRRLSDPFELVLAVHGGGGNTGLGLARSKGALEAMGGRLILDSGDSAGTTAAIELPAIESPLRATSGASGEPAPSERALGAPAPPVLCVDDNPANLGLVEHVLSMRAEVELVTAMTGEAALELARTRTPRLILLDLNLPGIGSTEVLAHLKADPCTRDVPVVILSADASPERAVSLVSAGAHAYLRKPLDVSELLNAVDGIIAVAGSVSP
jgi:signal transduction histidine kinase/ActR/RegA family two-component response regulator